MKKILLSTGAITAVLVGASMFAAFEAHVVNVTARIENALTVPIEPISFGTVFPQEELYRTLPISLSQSFQDEGRVDDVQYFIRQKPKCGVTNEDGTQIVGPTWTGHVVPVPPPAGTQGPWTYYVDCNLDAPDNVVQDPNNPELWLLPSLCQYLSKHSEFDGEEYEDGALNAFHQPFTILSDGTIDWNDVSGYLSKIAQDFSDIWTIDLKVPCFGGFCAQDWEDYVHDINLDADPALYTQDIDNEHKVFGCNLWVEVSGVSQAQPR